MKSHTSITTQQTTHSDAEDTQLKGNNRLLLKILQSNIYCLIKVEGRRMQFGTMQDYHDIISVKQGKLDYFLSYPAKELADYHKINTTMLLRLDNIDSAFVIRQFEQSTPAS